MFMKDKQPRAGVIDGEDIVDINHNEPSLPATLKGMKTPGPEKPAAFTKSVASILPSGQPILLPASHPDMVDWEGEFTVVIGKGGHRIPAAKALEHVAGYTIVNAGSD